jgi:hypothetical protein
MKKRQAKKIFKNVIFDINTNYKNPQIKKVFKTLDTKMQIKLIHKYLKDLLLKSYILYDGVKYYTRCIENVRTGIVKRI